MQVRARIELIATVVNRYECQDWIAVNESDSERSKGDNERKRVYQETKTKSVRIPRETLDDKRVRGEEGEMGERKSPIVYDVYV